MGRWGMGRWQRLLCTGPQLGPFPAEDVFLLSSRDRWTPLLYAVFSTSR